MKTYLILCETPRDFNKWCNSNHSLLCSVEILGLDRPSIFKEKITWKPNDSMTIGDKIRFIYAWDIERILGFELDGIRIVKDIC